MLPTSKPNKPASFVFFETGFRPFFLGATIFAATSMLLWMLMLVFQQPIEVNMPSITWHAHEMIYGYTMAIIAGFLLTAVKNWTGLPTVSGWSLALLFGLWLIARIAPYCTHTNSIHLMAIADILFGIALLVAVAIPIVKAKAWRQMAILSKLLLMIVGNLCFYYGLFGWLDMGVHIGLYCGFYLIIALILTMGRRVIPFFIERGVGYEVNLVNRRWLDISSMLLFLAFFLADVFFQAKQFAAASALLLLILHSIRLHGWHTHGIWRKPLLWSLFVGYAFIILGFPLYAAAVYFGISPFLSIHAFAYGGIGIITFSMISRVSLGHTGRNVHQASKTIGYSLFLLVLGACVRVIGPLLAPNHYSFWIASSQALWVISFIAFIIIYTPILFAPRTDNQPG